MRKGYTLIELLVGIGIFSLLVAGLSGFFFSALKIQRRILAFREIIDSTSYALDYMARALRMAKKDDIEIRGISKNCSGISDDKVNYTITHSGSGIKFRNYKNECQEFFLDNKRIKEIKEGETNYLTPETLEIVKMLFSVMGDSPGDNLQPRVAILLEVQKRNQPETKIVVQTTISQRDLDF